MNSHQKTKLLFWSSNTLLTVTMGTSLIGGLCGVWLEMLPTVAQIGWVSTLLAGTMCIWWYLYLTTRPEN